jgi:hypothetical protein
LLFPELLLPELVLLELVPPELAPPEPVPVEEVPPEPLPEVGLGSMFVLLIPLFPGGVAVPATLPEPAGVVVNVPDAVVAELDPAWVAVKVPAESVPIFPAEANVVEDAGFVTGGMPLIFPTADAGFVTGGMPLMRAGCVTVLVAVDWVRAVVEADAVPD